MWLAEGRILLVHQVCMRCTCERHARVSSNEKFQFFLGVASVRLLSDGEASIVDSYGE